MKFVLCPELIICAFADSQVAVLTPDVMLSGGGPLGGDEVVRVQPP